MTPKPRNRPRPSYSRQGIRLYLGDCLDLLPALGTDRLDHAIDSRPKSNRPRPKPRAARIKG